MSSTGLPLVCCFNSVAARDLLCTNGQPSQSKEWVHQRGIDPAAKALQVSGLSTCWQDDGKSYVFVNVILMQMQQDVVPW